MMSIKRIKAKRKSLCVVQCFFFAALGCLFPFLSAHMKEIGLTTLELAYLNTYTGLIAILGPLLFGPIAHKYNKYQTLLVVTIIGAGFAYTSLLFVPRVIRNPRHPQIVFDCTNNNLRMERCSEWDDKCQEPKKPANGNFTNFTLTKCKYVCPIAGSMNSSWYPLHVCFISSSEGNLCLVHDPGEFDKGYQTSFSGKLRSKGLDIADKASPASAVGQLDHLIQFDSRFDRWPAIDTKDDKKDCVYQTVAPLIVNHRPYESIQCRPYVQNCFIHCKVNMLHRPRNSPRSTQPRPPAPCFDLVGDPRTTFYSYLIIRSIADFLLFAAYTMIDGLAVTLMSNYDALYGGWAKVVSLALPMIVFPSLCGFLVDYYSSLAGHPDYAPPFVIFDGLLLITAVLVVAVPATPLALASVPVAHMPSQSTASLRSTPSLRALKQHRRKIPARSWYVLLLLVIPLALASGTQWGLLQTVLYPFYIQLGTDKFWLGLGCTVAYACLAPFAYLAKPLISGLGRAHLVILGFVFYTLRLSGISFLSHQPRWTLLPFEAMEAFTLAVAWIGVTSYAHSLIAASAPRTEQTIMSRTGALHPSTSAHLVLHYALNIIHFGLGRVMGAGLLILWLTHWDDSTRRWDWLNKNDIDLPEMDAHGLRILFRLMAIGSAAIALPFLFFYHVFGKLVSFCMMCLRALQSLALSCVKCVKKCFNALCCCSCKFNMCRMCRKGSGKPSPARPATESTMSGEGNANGNGHPGTLMNGGSYSRLVDQSAGANHAHFHHTNCKEVGNGSESRGVSINGSRTPIEMQAQPKRNFQSVPRMPNGSNRIKMSDVVGDDESLLSTR